MRPVSLTEAIWLVASMLKRNGEVDGAENVTRRQRLADEPNISGTWRLDKKRSEPIDPYLHAMGLCQIAIDGHLQKEGCTETYYTIEQTPSMLVINKLSWSGSSRREIYFGKTQQESGGQIPKKVSASIRGDEVVVTTELGKNRVLYDIKTLHDNGNSLKMVLQLVTPEEEVNVVRWLIQSEPPQDDDEDDA